MAHHSRKTPRQAADSGAAAPLTILLAENNPGDVRLTKERFAEACIPCTFHVTRTLDGTLDFLEERNRSDESPVDAVLLDGRLSTEADGSTVRRLTTANADVPLFLLVQTETEADLIDGSEFGSLPFLTKPVDPGEVRDRVRAALTDEHSASERSVE